MSAYDDLLEERYGRSLWWATPEKTLADETAALQRRMILRAAEAVEKAIERTKESAA